VIVFASGPRLDRFWQAHANAAQRLVRPPANQIRRAAGVRQQARIAEQRLQAGDIGIGREMPKGSGALSAVPYLRRLDGIHRPLFERLVHRYQGDGTDGIPVIRHAGDSAIWQQNPSRGGGNRSPERLNPIDTRMVADRLLSRADDAIGILEDRHIRSQDLQIRC
jgi:hypothetical protein